LKTKRSNEILSFFQRKLKVLEQIRKKQEALFLNNKIGRRDIEEIYAAIYLNSIASFESLIEELFIGLLAGRFCSSHSNVNVRAKIQSYMVARDMIFRDRKYYNWLPYENTEKVAKVFFTGGRPFTLLSQDEKDRLDKCLTIRHAIVHKSRYAINKFRKKVLASIILPPKDKRPKSFLRAQFSMVPQTTYYQQFIGDIFEIAKSIC